MSMSVDNGVEGFVGRGRGLELEHEHEHKQRNEQ